MQLGLLSLDVGTTLTKAVLFDLDGRELAVAEYGFKLHTPQPGWVELDPLILWETTLKAIQAIQAQVDERVEIKAIALSTQGGSLIPLGTDNEPTHNVITWLDQRAEGIVKTWQQEGVDQFIRKISGWAPQPGLPLPLICALRQHQPEVFTATQRFASVNDYLVYKLTGNFCTNPSMAGEMLLTNICREAWDAALCDLAGINQDQLSPIQPSVSVCGLISKDVCRETGLPHNIPLINGGQDHACEALALGLMTPGDYWLACGTAWVINGITETPDIEGLPPDMALNYHVIPERWISSLFLGGLGAGMEWWFDQIWQTPSPKSRLCRAESYQAFNVALESTSPGSSGLLFYPVSGTPRSGAVSGSYMGLRLDHTRADMGRAVMESAAYELHWALQELQKCSLQVQKLWMVGGATRNPVWPRILADVTGIPIWTTQYSHGPALGAAILAANGLGFMDGYPNWIVGKEFKPDPNQAPIYQASYNAYCGSMRKS